MSILTTEYINDILTNQNNIDYGKIYINNNGLIEIGPNAFKNRRLYGHLDLSNSNISIIRENAFENNSITSVSFSNNLREIRDNAFNNNLIICTNIIDNNMIKNIFYNNIDIILSNIKIIQNNINGILNINKIDALRQLSEYVIFLQMRIEQFRSYNLNKIFEAIDDEFIRELNILLNTNIVSQFNDAISNFNLQKFNNIINKTQIQINKIDTFFSKNIILNIISIIPDNLKLLLPESLYYLGENAFMNNNIINKLELPHNLNVIGPKCFFKIIYQK